MRNTRKGFTLIELLIVITIMSILSAAMAVSGSSANAAAKASAIYTNINAIKTAAIMYQVQEGTSFKESNVTAANLKDSDILDLDAYNNRTVKEETSGGTTTKNVTYDNIKYAIVAGETDASGNNLGAYVICSFADDGDAKNIAKALTGYKNIRIADGEASTNKYTVGAFLYHNTPKEKGSLAYDRDFDYTFPTTEPTEP